MFCAKVAGILSFLNQIVDKEGRATKLAVIINWEAGNYLECSQSFAPKIEYR